MTRNFIISFMMLLLTHGAAASQTAMDRFSTEINTLEAKFTQRVLDETGRVLENSSGTFFLSRPGKFRWNYQSSDPDIELGQEIIADGTFIFMHDPDLQQATQRSLQDALGQVPSLLLVQSDVQLDELFELTDYGLTDGLSWVALKPKNSDAAYKQLMIGFDGLIINQILLLDGLGNETKLQLSEVIENPKLPRSTFDFLAPPGTDILSE